jgi:NitT/TauT family transport system ATP-binding protein
MQDMEKNIIIKNVTKTYDGQTVLRQFSYTFEQGKVHLITGMSGIGKTTLLRIIMGLEKADTGSVTGVGTCSAVFQEDRLLPMLTPVANVRIATQSKTEQEIVEQLSSILPKDCLKKKVSELSGGMKRRVAIVRAMMSASDTVIMDEPFTGLDAATKSEVIGYILQQKKDRTLLIVTHDEEALFEGTAHICLLTRD